MLAYGRANGHATRNDAQEPLGHELRRPPLVYWPRVRATAPDAARVQRIKRAGVGAGESGIVRRLALAIASNQLAEPRSCSAR